MKDSLTNEQLRKKFKNNFDLCNFAIGVARDVIVSGTQASLGDILSTVRDLADESQGSL